MKVKYRDLVLQTIFFSLKFVGTAFVSASIILSHVITESTIILAKYLHFHNYV